MIFFIFKNINNNVQGLTVFSCVCVFLFKALCCRPLSTRTCRQDAPPTSREGHRGYIPEGDTHLSNMGHFDALVLHGFIVGLWEPFRLASGHLRGPQWSLAASLLSGVMQCSGLILYVSCPPPRVRHFSKEPWFLLLGSGT